MEIHHLAPRLAFPALIVANLVLAAGPWMVRVADVGPMASGFWRLVLALPFVLLIAGWQSRGRPRPAPRLIAIVGLAGLFFAADLAAWHLGILQTKLANATLFGNFASLLFAVYGFILVRQAPGRVQSMALALAVFGTALLLGRSHDLSPANFAGDLLCILAGVFYACYLVVVDRARRSLAPFPTLAIATVAGAPPLLLAAFLMGEQIMPGAWGPLILLSIGSQVVGQGLLIFAMGHLSPVVVGLGLLTQPVGAALIGWTVYGERLGWLDAVGAVLICTALVLIRLPQRHLASSASEAQ